MLDSALSSDLYSCSVKVHKIFETVFFPKSCLPFISAIFVINLHKDIVKLLKGPVDFQTSDIGLWSSIESSQWCCLFRVSSVFLKFLDSLC